MNFKLLQRSFIAGSMGVLLTACGGGGGSSSLATANAANARYTQTMLITFNGQGLDQNVEARVEGPCNTLTRLSGATSNTLQYSCIVHGVGEIRPYLVDPRDGVVLGALRVQIPLPRVSVTVTDGSRSGSFVLELDPAAAPASALQFMLYQASGFYTNTLFHRVRPDTAILGGGYAADAAGTIGGVKSPTQAALKLEQTGLKNLRGSIAMARAAGPDSANSMFFINTVDNPRFDAGSAETPEGYAVFGKVVDGLGVVDEIAKVPVRPDLVLGVNDVPVTSVRITAMTQTR